MKKFMILSLMGLSLAAPIATRCAQEVSDTGDADGGYFDFEYFDDQAGEPEDGGFMRQEGEEDGAAQQSDPFGAIEEPNPFDGNYEFWLPEEDEFADVPAEPQDPVTVVKRFVDDVFEQVANTNPLIELMKKTWPIALNNFYPEESKKRALSAEHMEEFVALLKQCPGWVTKPVIVSAGRWAKEEETLLSFAIGSAVPTPVLKAICDAGARVTQENVDHAYIWSSVQGKPHLAEVTKFINKRFADQKAKA
jgi:hypothetical protein